MSSLDLIGQVALVLFAMAVVSGIECVAPLRARYRARTRVRVNLVLTASVIGINWLGSSLIAVLVLASRAKGLGLLPRFDLPRWLQAVAGIALLDFLTYCAHVAIHRAPVLWRFHRVHHSDPFVDVTTSLRFHPLEALWRLLCTVIPALALGVPWQGFVVYRGISAVTGLLEHANVSVPAGANRVLSRFWVTPNMHKVHHSSAARHTDSNYGNILAFYDRIFGTFTPADRVFELEYGLETTPANRVDSLRKVLLLPFETSTCRATAPADGGARA